MKSTLLKTKGHFRPYLSEAMPSFPLLTQIDANGGGGDGSPKTMEPTDRNTERNHSSAQIATAPHGYEELTQDQSNAPSDLGRCLLKIFC